MLKEVLPLGSKESEYVVWKNVNVCACKTFQSSEIVFRFTHCMCAWVYLRLIVLNLEWLKIVIKLMIITQMKSVAKIFCLSAAAERLW